MTYEQSKRQDEYLSARHERFTKADDKVMIDANELANFICNMDVPPALALSGFYDSLSYVIDIIDLVGTLDNPELKRGWLFSWQNYHFTDSTSKTDGFTQK